MLNVLRDLGLKFFSLQSVIVLSICLYYFVGMQVSTMENIDPKFLVIYKITFISSILGLFLIFFAARRRSIVDRLSTRSGILTLIIWLSLIVITQQPSLIFMLVIVLTFYNKDYKKMTGYLFVWLSLLFLTFAILASLGLISSGEMLKYNLLVDSSEFESVTALGMGNPNTAMSFLLGIIMSGAYVFYDSRYKNRYGMLMLFASFAVYSLVGSRTGFICAMVFLLLYILDIRKLGSLLKLLTPLLVLSLIALSIFVGFRFGQTDNTVNDFLTTRPYQWHLRLENGALTNLIGNSDTYITDIGGGSERYPLDNQYIYLLARAGWLSLIAVVGMYLIGTHKNKSSIVMYMIFTSLVHCFVESLMFTAIVNMGLLFILSSLLLRSYEEKQVYEK